MKIEKVNENQIKCTLNREDLASRHLRISELAYGSDKARELFQDMMQQAQFELGFEAENLPLMIEAIPVSGECLILIVTKVEDPEELDTRFSNFTPLPPRQDAEASEHEIPAYADDILNCFEHLEELLEKLNTEENRGENQKELKKRGLPLPDSNHSISEIKNAMTRIFIFDSFQRLHSLASLLDSLYSGKNSLYLDEDTKHYYLVVSMSEHSPEQFNKICNILSEYGRLKKGLASSHTYYEEHFERIAGPDALQKMSIS